MNNYAESGRRISTWASPFLSIAIEARWHFHNTTQLHCYLLSIAVLVLLIVPKFLTFSPRIYDWMFFPILKTSGTSLFFFTLPVFFIPYNPINSTVFQWLFSVIFHRSYKESQNELSRFDLNHYGFCFISLGFCRLIATCNILTIIKILQLSYDSLENSLKIF